MTSLRLAWISSLVVACSGSSASAPASAADGSLEPSADAAAEIGLDPRDAFLLDDVAADGLEPSCATTTARAERLPLTVHLLVDASDSMLERTATGESKWDAAKRALTGFLQAPASAGLDVALTIFPLPHPGVPETCTSTAACLGRGPCTRGICTDSTPTDVKWCGDYRDCAAGQDCMPTGFCAGGVAEICLDYPGRPSGCKNGARCIRQTSGICEARYSCVPSTYASPRAKGTLPAGVGALISAIAAHAPEGDTPTGAALDGALRSTLTTMGDGPRVLIFVTDGLPVRCAPLDDASIASIAARAAKAGVKTYAVGVFSPADRAKGQGLVDAIARAGETTRAFVIDGTRDVGKELSSALEAIRTASIPCAYAIPKGDLDAKKVNVEVGSSKGKSVLPFVATRAGCGNLPGWTYDVDPAKGTPTKVELCPASCEAIAKDAAASVSIAYGCATIVR